MIHLVTTFISYQKIKKDLERIEWIYNWNVFKLSWSYDYCCL